MWSGVRLWLQCGSAAADPFLPFRPNRSGGAFGNLLDCKRWQVHPCQRWSPAISGWDALLLLCSLQPDGIRDVCRHHLEQALVNLGLPGRDVVSLLGVVVEVVELGGCKSVVV